MTWIDVAHRLCDLREREVEMARGAPGRKVRPDEADSLLSVWEASGERMSTWCEARGLNWYSLCAYKGWRGEPEVAFAEVVVHDEVRELEPVGRARYRVELGEVTIEVDDDFRADTLQRLIRTVAAC